MDHPRTVRVLAPGLPAGPLLLEQMTGIESLGRSFQYDVLLASELPAIPAAKVLGQPMAIEMDVHGDRKRHFHGVVTQFSRLGAEGRHWRYGVVLEPQLALYRHQRNSRMFQDVTAVDVIEELLTARGISFDKSLSDQYRKWEYLVQYQESDFDFITRLMEQEGLYSYYVHGPQSHTLVLADPVNVHPGIDTYVDVPYWPAGDGQQRARDHIDDLDSSWSVVPGVYSAKDFNFHNPRGQLYATRVNAPVKHRFDALETYEYPGEFNTPDEGDRYVRVRLDAVQAGAERVSGGGDARGLVVGAPVRIIDPDAFAPEAARYLITSLTHSVTVNRYESGEGPPETYRCRFTGVDAKKHFRLDRTTTKPVVGGPQTATVVGKHGEEIWTDKYGRVKVQFHWDRLGASDEKSSCWVRVAQIWAGAKWGGIHIPRVGQEVIVDFLDGDPDRPIVTGRVYNNDNLPPYDLPANQTQSGIKSRSTKGGGPNTFNEIRFEDKKGEEELYLQAERDMTTVVKNDQTSNIDQYRTTAVGADDELNIKGSRLMRVHGNLAVTVDGAGESAVQSTLDVTGKHRVHASDAVDVEAPNYITLACGGSSITLEPGKITLRAGGNAVVVLDASVLAESNDGTRVQLDADAVVRSSGGASLHLDPNVIARSHGGSRVALDGQVTVSSPGDILIDGATTTAQARSKAVMISGNSSVAAGGSGVDVNGGTVKVTGSGSVEIAAPNVKVG